MILKNIKNMKELIVKKILKKILYYNYNKKNISFIKNEKGKIIVIKNHYNLMKIK